MKLSAVLITRNQEWNVARLVESVLAEMVDADGDCEVVLVDSASTDRTVDEAAEHPIRVLVLSDDQPLTAAAGRHVGFLNTEGDYILFLDGDMELISGWLRPAMSVLDKNPDIAAVTGRRIDLPPDAPAAELRTQSAQQNLRASITIENVRHGGGAALYRRSCLEEVGSLNPYLYSDEEPELCIRLRYLGGYRIVRLDGLHVFHYSEPIERFGTLIRRARRNLYLGSGQNIRYLWGTPLLKPYLRERGFSLVPGAALIAGGVCVAHSAITRTPTCIGAWTAIVLTVVGIDAVRKRSLRRALTSALKRVLHVVGTVRGVLIEPADPAGYPGRFTAVR